MSLPSQAVVLPVGRVDGVAVVLQSMHCQGPHQDRKVPQGKDARIQAQQKDPFIRANLYSTRIPHHVNVL